MSDIAQTSFSFPAIRSKKVTGCFDGGAITSDAGVLLLAQAERRPGIVDRLAGVIPDDRDPSRVRHRVCDILRARAMAVACGYEDADDLDALRHDPGFMMAPGKSPGEEAGLVRQPTMSRFGNRANVRSLIHIGRERVDIFWSSCEAPPELVTLDIDDTFDAAYGPQQLTLFNGYHGGITGSAGMLRSMCTKRRAKNRSHSSCILRARHPAWKRAAMFVASSGAYDPIGRRPGSFCAGTGIMAARRSWRGAKPRQAWTSSLACQPWTSSLFPDSLIIDPMRPFSKSYC